MAKLRKNFLSAYKISIKCWCKIIYKQNIVVWTISLFQLFNLLFPAKMLVIFKIVTKFAQCLLNKHLKAQQQQNEKDNITSLLIQVHKPELPAESVRGRQLRQPYQQTRRRRWHDHPYRHRNVQQASRSRGSLPRRRLRLQTPPWSENFILLKIIPQQQCQP